MYKHAASSRERKLKSRGLLAKKKNKKLIPI